jgi:hypothetical protein
VASLAEFVSELVAIALSKFEDIDGATARRSYLLRRTSGTLARDEDKGCRKA